MSDEKLDTQVRREQIAQAALDLVATQGVAGLSIAAVARRVGLVPSGIYRHFRNKDRMIDAVLDLLEQRFLANVEAARHESSDALQCLRAVLMRHIRFIREGRAIPRIVFSDEMHSGHPQRRQRAREILAKYLAEVAKLVRQGQRDEQIRRELDAETVAVMFFGLAVPAGILWHLSDGGFDVTRHATRAWPVFRAAIAVKAARAATAKRVN